MAVADSAKNRGCREGPLTLVVNVNNKFITPFHLFLQTAEQDAYDFFTSAIDGDVLDHLPLPCHHNLNPTNETRGQDIPPSAAGVELTAEREERDEADTSALLEQQVNLHYCNSCLQNFCVRNLHVTIFSFISMSAIYSPYVVLLVKKFTEKIFLHKMKIF